MGYNLDSKSISDDFHHIRRKINPVFCSDRIGQGTSYGGMDEHDGT
jgi:hypothetical protein